MCMGVRRDVHRRQQAELASYRKKNKIPQYRLPAGYEKWFLKLPMQEQLYLVSRQADREAEAAAKQLRKTEAAAEADRKTEADKEVEAAASAQVSKVEQASPAPKEKDVFCLIAEATEAAEADAVERRAGAATDIKSVICGIQFKFHKAGSVGKRAKCFRWTEAGEWRGLADYQRGAKYSVGGFDRCYDDDTYCAVTYEQVMGRDVM